METTILLISCSAIFIVVMLSFFMILKTKKELKEKAQTLHNEMLSGHESTNNLIREQIKLANEKIDTTDKHVKATYNLLSTLKQEQQEFISKTTKYFEEFLREFKSDQTRNLTEIKTEQNENFSRISKYIERNLAELKNDQLKALTDIKSDQTEMLNKTIRYFEQSLAEIKKSAQANNESINRVEALFSNALIAIKTEQQKYFEKVLQHVEQSLKEVRNDREQILKAIKEPLPLE